MQSITPGAVALPPPMTVLPPAAGIPPADNVVAPPSLSSHHPSRPDLWRIRGRRCLVHAQKASRSHRALQYFELRICG
jgi:hypothetical protein